YLDFDGTDATPPSEGQRPATTFANLFDSAALGWHEYYVLDVRSAPPVAPNLGDAYIVGSNGTGGWTGKSDCVAVWSDKWIFFTPRHSHTARSISGEVYTFYDSANTSGSTVGWLPTGEGPVIPKFLDVAEQASHFFDFFGLFPYPQFTHLGDGVIED